MTVDSPMLGLISGSDFALDTFEVNEHRDLDTPYGPPSAPLKLGLYRGVPLCVLPRHGLSHEWPPHRINYRANLWALNQLGVDCIVSTATVGGINPNLMPGSLCIVDQIIDYTWGRESTFFDGGEHGVEHIEFTTPFSDNLRDQLIVAAHSIGLSVEPQGVYATTQGPRLETAAEINRYERDGADVVGMTGMPEAALARELGLPYAMIAVVVNKAAGRGSVGIFDEIKNTTAAAMRDANVLLAAFLSNRLTA